MTDDMVWAAHRKCGCLVAVSFKTDDREAKNRVLIKDWEQRDFCVSLRLAHEAAPSRFPCKYQLTHFWALR